MQPSKSGILNNVLNERFIRRMVGCWLERGSAIIQPRLLYRHQFNTISKGHIFDSMAKKWY